MTETEGRPGTHQTALDALRGAVITGFSLDVVRHRLQIDIEAQYDKERSARHAPTMVGVASLTLTDGSLEVGKEYCDIAWDCAELTSISAVRRVLPSGTFWHVCMEVWSTRIDLLCRDLTIVAFLNPADDQNANTRP